MSHFVVIVAGDVDHNLAPFHEFECTGADNEFVVAVDQTNDAIESFKGKQVDGDYNDFADFVSKWYGFEAVPFGEEPDLEGRHKYGYYTVDESGEPVGVFNRTNPNAKWDWYQVGGRWSGYFKLKSGKSGEYGEKSWMNAGEENDSVHCDVALKGDIDFEGMRKAADDACRERYRLIGYSPEMTWRPWEEIAADETFTDWDERRKFYNSQEDLAKLKATLQAKKEEFDFFFFDFDSLLGLTEDEYVEKRSDRGIVPYALVIDRKWMSRGDMGWFGASSNEISNEEWVDIFQKKLSELPDDTLLSAVDCHI